MVTWPTDFPGLVIDPNRQCVVNQVEVGRFPVRICECFSECTNPGAPLPLVVECFIYGEQIGNMQHGCPIITGGALGLTLGTLETHFLVRLDLLSNTDFLQNPSADPTNTALRFNLYLAKPVGVYEVFLVDGANKRAKITFTPSVDSILWVNIPLSDFTILDVGFSFNAVRYIYFGFTDNYQIAECMMALDNVRICTNTVGGIASFSFEPDTEPYGSNLPDDVCVMLEGFDTIEAIAKVLCDAPEPGSPTPEECDTCVIGPPITNGNQATHFRVCIPGSFPPSIRYLPPAGVSLVTNVTFTVYSWRPGVNIRVIMVDGIGRRAIYNFVAVGGAQTLTVLLGAFSNPDGAFDWTSVMEWWTIFGTVGVNSTDRFGLDELKTNSGATLINDMSSLTDIECGYDNEPPPPGNILTCQFVQRTSVIDPGGRGSVNFDELTWAGPLSIGTVSQLNTTGAAWDLGFDTMHELNADLQIAFNLPFAPAANSIREIILTMFDEAGREVMLEITPPALGAGDNLITIDLGAAGKDGEPTRESKGFFDARKVMYWQLAFIGFTSVETYPFVINFEGFQFRQNAGVTKTFLFSSYATQNDFENDGGRTCFEDWRLVNITPPGTQFTFLAGHGVTVNTDGSFTPTNVGVDRGREPIDVTGQETRAERWLEPPYELPGGIDWVLVELKYRARPDPGGPARMHLVIRDDTGATATYSFDNGAGVADADGVKTFQTVRGSFSEPIGHVGNTITLIRLLKEGITNQTRSGTQGTGQDIFSGDEVDLVSVTFLTLSLTTIPGKASTSTVMSVRDGSIGAMADDQPPTFDGHIHHETDCGANANAGDPPPVWPFTPNEGTEFTGWLKLYKFVQTPDGVSGLKRFDLAGGIPIDISSYYGNQDHIYIFAVGTALGSPTTLWTLNNIRLILHDSGLGSLDIPMQQWRPANTGMFPQGGSSFPADDAWRTMEFRPMDGTPDPVNGFDNTQVTYAELVAGPWYTGKIWFARVDIGAWATRTTLMDWGRATWSRLMAYTNPANQFTVSKVLDSGTTPVVALNCDRTKSIAYWGMDEDWVRAAEIILVPEKYKDDSIVGLNGNRGYDPLGNPLPGVLEALARDTRAWYGNIAFRVPPFAGCRNIWMDICYIDEVTCLGVDLAKTLYEFWDAECGCILQELSQEISNLITDRWMDRILPDDQFILEPGAQPLPSGYPEAIRFEYCAIPECDQEVSVDTADFTFLRKTPTCSRPDDPLNTVYGHYRVEVEITALNAPITVAWADVLPIGETLISGAMSDTLNFTSIGETQRREYILKTAQIQGGSAVITGSATVVPNPPAVLASPAITMGVDCDTLSWHSFGSQDPNVFGQVFWAGGGRPDPVIPPDVNLWAKVYAGPGSAGLSKREQYLFADATVPNAATDFWFQLGGTGVEGFSVGLPVWAFNTDFVDNPARKITGLDIEAQEVLADPDEEVTGLYGTVLEIDAINMRVRVLFYTAPNQQVRFTMLARACLMVAPQNSRGYYLEASPALVDVCKMIPYLDQSAHTVLRWGYRYWNSTRYPAPGTNGAAYICDGDGEIYLYALHGDQTKAIINPVDWIDLLCSPVQETKLLNDAIPFQDDVRVCDICLFDPCSVIQIVDENCTGREGSGPGYVGTVHSTAPDNPGQDCNTLYTVEGHLRIIPAIQSAVVGCGIIDGFRTTRRARAFVKPDVARYAYSPTTKVYPNGVPVEGQNFVGVDFATGTFTFIPGVVVSNPCSCYRTLNAIIQLDTGIPAIYFLKGIDKSGCKSPPSKPIKVVGPAGEEPNDCGVGRAATLLYHYTLNGNETEYPGPPPAYIPVVGATFNFSLSIASRVEFRVSLFGWDVVWGSVGGKDMAGWTELWIKDMSVPDPGGYYPLADRFLKVVATDLPTAEGDGGAGSVVSRVVDLLAGNHVFGLFVRNGAPPSLGRIRFPLDLQVWRFGRCEQGPM